MKKVFHNHVISIRGSATVGALLHDDFAANNAAGCDCQARLGNCIAGGGVLYNTDVMA